MGLPGREEGGAQLQVKGILLPVCPGPPDHAGSSLSKKGGEGQRAQATGLSVLSREVKGEYEHAGMHAGKRGLEAAWHGEQGGAPADTASWELCLQSQVPGNARFACHGFTWDAQRWGRHSSATQSSLQSLRVGGPAADAQGWDRPVSGTDAMTITLRTEPPISLGPHKAHLLRTWNLHLMGWELPEQGSALVA